MVLLLTALLVTCCQPSNFYTREAPGLRGWSESRLLEKFGGPDRSGTNTVAQIAHSPEPWQPAALRVLSMYPTNVEANLKVRIKTLSWQRGRIYLTAWLREQQGVWTTLYAEEWNMNVME